MLTQTISRNVVITVECAEATDAELELTYQVHGAYWSPSYDVRVRANADKPSMKVYYFGKIHQSSGEDWNDVELTLSTAQPRLGGTLPKVGTLKAKLRKVETAAFGARMPTFSAAAPTGGALFGGSSAAGAPPPAADAQVTQMVRREALHAVSTFLCRS